MSSNHERSGRPFRSTHGFTLLELMTVVAILGILAAFAYPNTKRMLNRQEAKASATELAGLLNGARTQALAEGTPHLVYFDAPGDAADGGCAALAVEVRDADHSYSITPGDDTVEFRLPGKACETMKPVGADPNAAPEIGTVPLPNDDLAARAPDAAEIADASASNGQGNGNANGQGNGNANGQGNGNANGQGNGNANGQGNGNANGQGNGNANGQGNGAAHQAARTATVAETVVNGASFPVDADGRAVVAFSERGIPVDPNDPTSWGSGAGGVYLTDGETIVGAVVSPLGKVQMRVFDLGTSTWQ